MLVSGVIIDVEDLNVVRAIGFTDFRVLTSGSYEEMHYDDEPAFQEFMCNKETELDKFSTEYMCGEDDAKYFYFSDKPDVQQEIVRLFPSLELVTVECDDYPLDYSYVK